jgi:glycosyltransferase involved in cell wall biosynthesis
VVTVHDLSFERDPSLMGRRDRLIFRTVVPRAARRAARVLAVSERTKRDLIELYGVPEEKIVVTPNGVDPAFSPEGPRDDGAGGRYALVVGTLQRRKDPEAAIEALALLGDHELRLVFAGPDKGGRAKAETAAQRMGLGSRVEFRGHVPQEELLALYRGAACLVFPSRYEGFGLPVLEAMAAGTPVVATTAGALPEVAGDAAILVEEANPVALAGGIERALADRERLVAGGLERARRFSWAETAGRTLEVYRELL